MTILDKIMDEGANPNNTSEMIKQYVLDNGLSPEVYYNSTFTGAVRMMMQTLEL